MDGERFQFGPDRWEYVRSLLRPFEGYRFMDEFATTLPRTLAPWLNGFEPRHARSWIGYTEEEVRRWWHRFLD